MFKWLFIKFIFKEKKLNEEEKINCILFYFRILSYIWNNLVDNKFVVVGGVGIKLIGLVIF